MTHENRLETVKLVRELRAEEYDREGLPCRVCGENLTPFGRTCPRCMESLLHDQLEKESGR